jgi:hypothetical protein
MASLEFTIEDSQGILCLRTPASREAVERRRAQTTYFGTHNPIVSSYSKYAEQIRLDEIYQVTAPGTYRITLKRFASSSTSPGSFELVSNTVELRIL